MNRRLALAVCLLLLGSINRVYAVNGSFADDFLGSPLLVLAAIIVIVAVAFVYHRIRK